MTLKGVLETMKEKGSNGKPARFSISFYTFDKKRKKGGRLREIHEAELLIAPRASKAQHKKNRTINIRPYQNGIQGRITKVHLDFIQSFNGIHLYAANGLHIEG